MRLTALVLAATLVACAQTKLITPVTVGPKADHSVGGKLTTLNKTGAVVVNQADENGFLVNSTVLAGTTTIKGNASAPEIILTNSANATTDITTGIVSVDSTIIPLTTAMTAASLCQMPHASINIWYCLGNDGSEGTLTLSGGTSTVGPELTFFSGNPNTHVSAQVGSLSMDASGGATWYKASGAGTNTGWTQLSAGGSGVTSLNSLTGALNITAGTGITITPSTPNIAVSTNAGTTCSTAYTDCMTLDTVQSVTASKLFVALIDTETILPLVANTYTLGSSSFYWNNIWSNQISTISLAANGVSAITAVNDIIPNSAQNLGSSSNRWGELFVNAVGDASNPVLTTYTDGLFVLTGIQANGVTGQTTPITASGTCSMNFNFGIMTSHVGC